MMSRLCLLASLVFREPFFALPVFKEALIALFLPIKPAYLQIFCVVDKLSSVFILPVNMLTDVNDTFCP
jgi:hypothetical protein